jgi:peptidyl-prolyl cis-trans isomerase A (cyclophilin A)
MKRTKRRTLQSILGLAAWSLLVASSISVSHACDLPGLIKDSQTHAVVRLTTALGHIDIQVDLQHAPITACNFLKYIARGAYDGGSFGRTVRPANQLNAAVPISVVQAYPSPTTEPMPPILLERTDASGLHHKDGTISMARGSTDDATSEFFICIGDQPELDYGGHRNSDGQGFAAFGQVIRGMDIVRRIHMQPASGEELTPPVLIKSAKVIAR